MPSSLAPDPINVFVAYSEPIEIVWWKHLSFYLSHYPIRVMNPSIGAIGKWRYLLLLKLKCPGSTQNLGQIGSAVLKFN